MGIDIYLWWKGKTEAESEAQYTGFNTQSGDVGYLREAYHGEPYATSFLVSEAFNCENGALAGHEEGYVPISAATLRERLPVTVSLAVLRDLLVYQTAPNDPGVIEGKDGAQQMFAQLRNIFGADGQIAKAKNGGTQGFDSDILQHAGENMLVNVGEMLPEARAFVEFVELAERKEHETGQSVEVCASY